MEKLKKVDYIGPQRSVENSGRIYKCSEQWCGLGLKGENAAVGGCVEKTEQ